MFATPSVALVLVVSAVAAEAARAEATQPIQDHGLPRLRDVLPEDLRRLESSPDGQAAWEACKRAVEGVVPFDEYVETLELDDAALRAITKELGLDPDAEFLDPLGRLQFDVARGARPWPTGRPGEILEGWIASSAKALAAIDGAGVVSDAPAGLAAPEDLSEFAPWLSRMRGANDLVELAIARDLGRGDREGAVARWDRLTRFATRVSACCPASMGPSALEAVLRVSTCAAADRIASMPGIAAPDLDRLQAGLASLDGRRRLASSLVGGALSDGYHVIAQLGTGSADEIAALVARPLSGAAKAAAERAVRAVAAGHPSFYDRGETVRLLVERLRAVVEDASRPWHEIRPLDRAADLHRELAPWSERLAFETAGLSGLWVPGAPLPDFDAAWAAEILSPAARQTIEKVRNPLGKWLVLAEIHGRDSIVRNARALEVDRLLSLLRIALLRHERSEGALPQDLSGLVERGIVEAVPPDPWSGKALGYSRTRRLIWSAGRGNDFAPPEEPFEPRPRDPVRRIPRSPPPSTTDGPGSS